MKVQTNLNNTVKIIALILLMTSSVILFTDVSWAQNDSKILFDESGPYGKYYTIYNTGLAGSSSFAALLNENGYSVSRLTDVPITNDILKDYDVLILMGPARNYDDHEINAIKEFVNNGGGLLLLADPWGPQDGDNNYAFNKIARSFGVDFAFNQRMVDKQHNIIFSHQLKINDIRSHPVTANVSELYYITGAYQNPGSAEVLALSDADSWSDHGYVTSDNNSQNNEIKEAGEIQGPLPLLSAMNYGKGKIVFMGSVQTFMNSWLYRSGGWKLGLNSVNWLSNHPVATNYKTAGLISLNVGDLLYRVIGMVLLPILLLSGLIYINRGKESKTIKSIKNWKYNALVVINVFFAILAVILFFPINIYYFDMSLPWYDPNFGYVLLITGIISLVFAGSLIYGLIMKQRINKKYSYFYMVLLLFFVGLDVIIGVVFPAPTDFFAVGGLLLLIPLFVNLWYIRGYGEVMIIEGKEFNRLEKLSFKSLPYELQNSYSDPIYIGEGGFGRVFKAKNLENKDVAIKIPKSFDKRAEKTFISEVSNWSHLDHPNIVKLNEFKILPIPYIEMEFCEGNLEHGKKSLEKAVSIVYSIAKGLQYAHHQKIIHGDVKTSNIMIGNGAYKISDWGLSKLKTGESITLSGATPQYAAPEQISHEFGKSDERTDVYQLGTVFYELVTGQLPFKGEMSEIYGSIINTIPTLPSEINPAAEKFEPIIMKCLNKDKKDRYSSMGDLIKDLEEYFKP